MLKGLGATNMPIRIENGLFEPENENREFLSLKELKEAGFNVDMDYKSQVTLTEEQLYEDKIEACARGKKVMDTILPNIPDGRKVFIVGHQFTYDMTTAILRGLTRDKAHQGRYCQPYRCVESPTGIWKEGQSYVKQDDTLTVRKHFWDW